MLARAWGELFPDEAIPNVLAQPCCAQFALSRDRIRSIPHARYVYYRDWLLGTDLSDYITGRIWEYLWQYVFTGEAVLCVEETVCLCDGYGFCFGGDDEFREYQALEAKVTELQNDIGGWMWLADDLDFGNDGVDLTSPAAGDDESLRQKIEGAENEIVERLQAAVERGKNPRNRALEAGRPWKEGDGF